jgi:hypothetical protein
MLLFYLFTICILAARNNTVDARFCTFTGCGDGTNCQCVPFFASCDTTNNKEGLCVLTEVGTWIVISTIIVLIALLILAIACLCCCCCCKRRGKTEIIHVHSDSPHGSRRK